MSNQNERREKRATKEQGKIFQMKEENENISFNFYQQIFVLLSKEMQIQLRHCELFCKTAVQQDITKIVNFFFTKLELIFSAVY